MLWNCHQCQMLFSNPFETEYCMECRPNEDTILNVPLRVIDGRVVITRYDVTPYLSNGQVFRYTATQVTLVDVGGAPINMVAGDAVEIRNVEDYAT